MSELSDLYSGGHPRPQPPAANFRALPDASHTAEGYNPLCGDRLTLYLKVADGIVSDVAFEGAAAPSRRRRRR
jgi:nitrogen fixation NifU-like protein